MALELVGVSVLIVHSFQVSEVLLSEEMPSSSRCISSIASCLSPLRGPGKPLGRKSPKNGEKLQSRAL